MKMERVFSWKFWEKDQKRRENLEKMTGKKVEKYPVTASLKCLLKDKKDEK